MLRETGSKTQTRGSQMGHSLKAATFLIESRMRDAAMGDVKALYELGVAYSTGTGGVETDFIEAHKWFNLAALNGSNQAQECRADIAEDMSAREIAEAQRQARAWLADFADVRRVA
jgi:TPR repeat protein